MIIKYGNLYTEDCYNDYDFIGFTANSVINNNGELVMGAGNAKVAKETYKGLSKRLGSCIKHLSKFYLMFDTDTKIFALQTKVNWKDKSPVNLVKKSIFILWYEATIKNPDKKFAVPFPAISHGGLTEEMLLPTVKMLPNNVHIWKVKP